MYNAFQEIVAINNQTLRGVAQQVTDYPAYLRMLASGKFDQMADTLMDKLAQCDLCPHVCRTNRHAGELGYCRAGKDAEISGYGPHFGEEPPLVGHHGSGTIFFSHCNLGCVYCQNWDISHNEGEKITTAKLARIMLELQDRGCHNINLVTPSHYVAQIIVAVVRAASQGLRIPLVYNCGGYESWETLKLLDGIVDIYMPDFKYANPEMGRELSKVTDYWEIAKMALKEMHRQVGDLVTDERGIAREGLIIRHLVLPARLAGTEEIMQFVAEEISPYSYINVMDQYHPAFKAGCHSELNRPITRDEFRLAVSAAKKASPHFRLAHETQVVVSGN